MDEDVFPGLWSIPGGKVGLDDPSESTLENALKREVKEEVGVEIAIDSYLESHADGAKLYIIFNGHIAHGEPQPLEDTDRVDWFHLHEIDESTLCPNVSRLLRLAAKK